MANFTATVSIEIQRVNGEKTVITEVVKYDAGDNPRFDRSSSEEALSRATRKVLHRVDPSFVDA